MKYFDLDREVLGRRIRQRMLVRGPHLHRGGELATYNQGTCMPHLKKEFTIKPRDFIRAGEVSIQVQSILKAIGFNAEIIRRASICAYESEMNVVMHGGPGIFTLTVDTGMIMLEVSDDGPGIEDIELAMQEGYSTAPPEYRDIGFGAGMGLPNIKKNADHLDIGSRPGQGTRLKICVRVNEKHA